MVKVVQLAAKSVEKALTKTATLLLLAANSQPVALL